MLPTLAATAWYHHKLPSQPAELAPLLQEVESFAMNDYALALAKGTTLGAEQRAAVAARLHQYTGLPVDYILKANLRVNGRPCSRRRCNRTPIPPRAGWTHASPVRRSIRSASRPITIR